LSTAAIDKKRSLYCETGEKGSPAPKEIPSTQKRRGGKRKHEKRKKERKEREKKENRT